jgi:hypothetical protein
MAWRTTERDRECVPEPHESVQSLQPLNVDTWQCTGHAPRLHVLVSDRWPHALPPCDFSRSMVRERIAIPSLPHVTEQLPQSAQADSWQSTAHGTTLHSCDSERSGHATPPFATAVAMVRSRICTPPPHVVEHAFHVAHTVTTQSVGQDATLHASSSLRLGHT